MARSSLAICLVALLAAPAACARIQANASSAIPITEIVRIDSVEVYSQSSGHGLLNQCTAFARSAVDNEAQPVVEVCGTGTKVTVFLRNRCEGYHEYTEVIGACNTGASSSTCETKSPATDRWLMTAQSYKIEQC
mmetsp:Transcript_132728/g.370077  ORF Transcript_132728/g.370077 Transcript_132728/m.370077 type:complete len:135 (+) Transcript_132728:75-479(+)